MIGYVYGKKGALMPYRPLKIKPEIGSFVACHVFGVVKHIGIWVDDAIVELQGSGLIRVVSPQRFLKDRTGDQIYVSCINGCAIKSESLAKFALEQVYQYRKYDLLKNNCYRFCYSCLTGHEEYIETFSEFNQIVSLFYQSDIEWIEAPFTTVVR